jgi:xanthine dehydrogenase small subunit
VLAELPEEVFDESPNTTQRIERLVKQGILPDYFCSIPERLSGLAAYPQPTADASFPLVAGGTDIYVQKGEHLHEQNITSLADRPDLKGIKIANDLCTIGAAVTVESLRRSDVLIQAFPRLVKSLELVSSTQIRNRATVAGNIINASPIGDLTILLLALDAEIHLITMDGDKKRSMPLCVFFTGYKTMERRAEELVSAFTFKLPSEKAFYNFEKVSKRTYLDIASVNTAMQLEVEDGIIHSVHLSAGGVAPIPLYLTKTSAFLPGRPVSRETIVDAIACAGDEIAPISDVRGSAEYKRLLLGKLIEAHFISTGLI